MVKFMKACTIYFQTSSTGKSNSTAPRLVERKCRWKCPACPRTYCSISGVNLHRRHKHDAGEQIRLENKERKIARKEDTISKNDEITVRQAINKAMKTIESRTSGRLTIKIPSGQLINEPLSSSRILQQWCVGETLFYIGLRARRTTVMYFTTLHV